MPSHYPVIDTSWVDGLSQYEFPFGGDLEPFAVHKLAKNVGKDVKGGKERGGGLFEGVLMEIKAYEGSKGFPNVEEDNCDKKYLSAYHLEGKKLRALNEMNLLYMNSPMTTHHYSHQM